jgi:hypothetical protein
MESKHCMIAKAVTDCTHPGSIPLACSAAVQIREKKVESAKNK